MEEGLDIVLPESIHPDNEGFERMVSTWFQGIIEVDAPANSRFTDDDCGDVPNTCDKSHDVSSGLINTWVGNGLDVVDKMDRIEPFCVRIFSVILAVIQA